MLSRLLAIVVIVAIAACGSRPRRARRPGQEYLAKIEMTGNTAIETESLVRGLSLDRTQRGGRAIDEYQLSLDVQRIESAYQRRGYLNVEVEPRVERRGDAQILVFEITEGPQASAIVDIQGLPPEVPLEIARALVELENGATFNYSAFDAAKAPLMALVENAGYAHAQLDASVLADRANNRAILRYVVDPGPRVVFGDIEVIGVGGSLAEAIKNRSIIQPGEPYSTQAIADTQGAILGIGRFTSVRVDVDRAGLATTVPVKITVAEAKRNEIAFGGGAGVDAATYQARAVFSYSHAGWPNPLTKAGVEFRPALVALRDDCVWYEVWNCELNPRARLLGTVRQQDLWVRGLDGEVQGGLDYLAIEAYTYYGPRVKLGLDLPLAKRRFHATAGWQFGLYEFTDLDPAVEADAARLGIDSVQRVGAFTQGVSADFRDDPVSPRFGAYAAFNVAEGSSIAGGAFDYVQLTPDVRGYLPFGPFVLGARARLGVIFGDVPATERYYAGGAASQRGFPERRLSPVAYERDPVTNEPVSSVVIGGAASFETSLELRTHFKLWGEKFGVVAFLDGGDVTEETSALELGNLHWAAGIGLRPYYLPVGPIRVEVAYRLNRTGADEPRPAASAWDRLNWILSIGEAF